jgi:hypothetical protein
MSLYTSLPHGYDTLFNPPLLVEPETECHSCHQAITEFDTLVWLNIGHGLSDVFHAECGAEVWAEALDLPNEKEDKQ